MHVMLCRDAMLRVFVSRVISVEMVGLSESLDSSLTDVWGGDARHRVSTTVVEPVNSTPLGNAAPQCGKYAGGLGATL